MQTINYASFVSSARAAARDIIRTKKVSALLGFIRNQKAKLNQITKGRESIVERQEAEVKRSETNVARAAHALKVAQDTNNPDVESFKKEYEATVKSHEKFVAGNVKSNKRELEDYDARAEKDTEAINEKIAEYTGKIEAWQNGESKVRYEEMITLAESLMEDKVSEAFINGEYADVTTDEDEAQPESEGGAEEQA